MEQKIEVEKFSSSGNLSIGTVSKLTGISVHTLRAWEKRHNVVSVVRSGTGRRLYRPEDVHRLRLLKRLTVAGHSIGNIAVLDDSQLEQMFDLEETPHNHEVATEVRSTVDLCLYSNRSISSALLKTPLKNAINIRLETAEIGELREALSGKKNYSVVMMFDTVQKLQLKMLRQLKESEPHHTYFLVFSFAQREMIDELNAMGYHLLRAPISHEHLLERVFDLQSTEEQSISHAKKGDYGVSEVPPHKFTRRQLDKLSQLQHQFECECAPQIADLIRSLTMVESTCQNCATSNRLDAQLHNDMYKLTAQARNLMERSISLVLEAENINLDHFGSR